MSIITHVALEDNIHELVFEESSRKAIDHFLGLLVKFQEDVTDDVIYVVLDLRHSGMLPLRYLTKSLRQLLDQYPHQQQAKIALVLEDPQMLNVARALLRTFMERDSVQYFTQIEKARLWLQIEQNNRKRR